MHGGSAVCQVTGNENAPIADSGATTTTVNATFAPLQLTRRTRVRVKPHARAEGIDSAPGRNAWRSIGTARGVLGAAPLGTMSAGGTRRASRCPPIINRIRIGGTRRCVPCESSPIERFICALDNIVRHFSALPEKKERGAVHEIDADHLSPAGRVFFILDLHVNCETRP